MIITRCSATTKKSKRCKNRTSATCCWIHIHYPCDVNAHCAIVVEKSTRKSKIEKPQDKQKVVKINIEYVQGDIGNPRNLKIKFQYPLGIVNAANNILAPGGGVTGSLVKAVGGEDEWENLVNDSRGSKGQKKKLPLSVGDAVYTSTSGRLQKDNVSYIIHGVGPIAGQDELELVKVTIRNVLVIADFLQLKSLILPAISGGIYVQGNKDLGKRVRTLIKEAIKEYINDSETNLETIYIISYDDEDAEMWQT